MWFCYKRWLINWKGTFIFSENENFFYFLNLNVIGNIVHLCLWQRYCFWLLGPYYKLNPVSSCTTSGDWAVMYVRDIDFVCFELFWWYVICFVLFVFGFWSGFFFTCFCFVLFCFVLFCFVLFVFFLAFHFICIL